MTDNTNTHPFDQAVQLTGTADSYEGHTSPHYANMVGPFGGITAATLLKAILIHPQRQGDPLSLTVNYAAPVADGRFHIQAKPVRTNRSTQHWYVELEQQGQVAATATAVCANRRHTWAATELPFPAVPAAQDVASLARAGFPAWVNQYDLRLIQGGMTPLVPIADPQTLVDSVSLLWIRDEPRRSLDFLSLTAIADTFFPRIYVRRQQFVPVGTVSFTLHFHADAAALAVVGERAVLGHARANRFYNNYFDQTAEVWSPEGDLLATSSQIVYFKE
ncbi:MAG: thioesterase family protein [Ardenticatenaceae bacterium]|nr:thioesterase family protein [Ardenticatenaceae bacterium]